MAEDDHEARGNGDTRELVIEIDEENPGPQRSPTANSPGYSLNIVTDLANAASNALSGCVSPRLNFTESSVIEEDEDNEPTEDVHHGTRTACLSHVAEFRGMRGYLWKVLSHPNFDLAVGLVIIANIGVMVVEADQNAPCVSSLDKSACQTVSMSVFNNIFLGIYAIEAAARIIVLHCKVFHSKWNCFDLFIVVTGFLDLVLSSQSVELPGPSVAFLRMFRVFRLLRAVRIFQTVPELYAMLRGFLGAMVSMAWGFVMIVVLLLVFAVLTVELVYPAAVRIHEDNAYCRDAFSTVWNCMLMYFQTLVAGDSWGACTLPIIKDQFFTFFIFSGSLVCIQLGFMNLILAVIVERAANAKQDDVEEAKKKKKNAEFKATHKLAKLMREIDADGSGAISLEELLEGYDENAEMQNLFSKLDITRKDVSVMFDLMDSSNEGELSIDFLIDNLRMCQLDDTRKSLTMLRLQSRQIAKFCKYLANGNTPFTPSVGGHTHLLCGDTSPRSQKERRSPKHCPNQDDSLPPPEKKVRYADSDAYPYRADGDPCPKGPGKSVNSQANCSAPTCTPKDIFDAEVAALRARLEQSLAGILGSVELFGDSISATCSDMDGTALVDFSFKKPLPHNGSTVLGGSPLRLPPVRIDPTGQSHTRDPAYKFTNDDELRGPSCKLVAAQPSVDSEWRFSALISDESLMVRRGPCQGELSL